VAILAVKPLLFVKTLAVEGKGLLVTSPASRLGELLLVGKSGYSGVTINTTIIAVRVAFVGVVAFEALLRLDRGSTVDRKEEQE
jgi:hypothetical protein